MISRVRFPGSPSPSLFPASFPGPQAYVASFSPSRKAEVGVLDPAGPPRHTPHHGRPLSRTPTRWGEPGLHCHSSKLFSRLLLGLMRDSRPSRSRRRRVRRWRPGLRGDLADAAGEAGAPGAGPRSARGHVFRRGWLAAGWPPSPDDGRGPHAPTTSSRWTPRVTRGRQAPGSGWQGLDCLPAWTSRPGTAVRTPSTRPARWHGPEVRGARPAL